MGQLRGGARRLPDDIAKHLAEGGFYRMFVPEAYGGLETPPGEAMEAIETVTMIATDLVHASRPSSAATSRSFAAPWATAASDSAYSGGAAEEGPQVPTQRPAREGPSGARRLPLHESEPPPPHKPHGEGAQPAEWCPSPREAQPTV